MTPREKLGDSLPLAFSCPRMPAEAETRILELPDSYCQFFITLNGQQLQAATYLGSPCRAPASVRCGRPAHISHF